MDSPTIRCPHHPFVHTQHPLRSISGVHASRPQDNVDLRVWRQRGRQNSPGSSPAGEVGWARGNAIWGGTIEGNELPWCSLLGLRDEYIDVIESSNNGFRLS
ncbi:hypothetical protein VTI28DRAFT_5955 [Corynascus sepedonium]